LCTPCSSASPFSPFSIHKLLTHGYLGILLELYIIPFRKPTIRSPLSLGAFFLISRRVPSWFFFLRTTMYHSCGLDVKMTEFPPSLTFCSLCFLFLLRFNRLGAPSANLFLFSVLTISSGRLRCAVSLQEVHSAPPYACVSPTVKKTTFPRWGSFIPHRCSLSVFFSRDPIRAPLWLEIRVSLPCFLLARPRFARTPLPSFLILS